MYLPNGTPILRRQAIVPACKEDNECFGTIEQKIREGTFSPDEAYLWAFKLHAGFLALDSRLNANRANSKFGPVSVFGLAGAALQEFQDQTVTTFRQLYRIWKHGGQFSPSPLGSVFDLPSRAGDFWYQVSPLGYVGFNLDTHFLAVALFDGGFAREQDYEAHWTQGMAGLNFGSLSPAPPDPQLFEGFWMLHMAHSTYHAGKGKMLAFTARRAKAIPEPYVIQPTRFEKLLLDHGPAFGVYSWLVNEGHTITLKVGTRVALQEFLNTLA
jgi:hypothetical protein